MVRLVVSLLLICGAVYWKSLGDPNDTFMNLSYKLQCALHHGFSYYLNMIELDWKYNDRVGYWAKHSDYPLAQGTVTGYDHWDGPGKRYMEFALKWSHNCTQDGEWAKEEQIDLGTCRIGTTCEARLDKTLGN